MTHAFTSADPKLEWLPAPRYLSEVSVNLLITLVLQSVRLRNHSH